jgi:GR25 family glycosyltransferase involved in LPS biosynthesis
MIIKIISLKKAIERRKFIQKQFAKLRLSYEFIDAIDPKSCSKDILKLFSISKFKSFYNRLPNAGEIGASISHDLARKKFLHAKDAKTLLVLEDDAEIMCTQKELISVAKIFEKSKFDILILGFSKCDNDYERHTNIINPIFTKFKIKNKIKIGERYLHTCSGSVGYMIKKKPSEIISEISKLFNLSDDWNYFSKLGLKIAYTNPMIVRENIKELFSYAEHENISQVTYKDDRIWMMFLLYCRKHIYGNVRKLLLYLKF